MTTNFFGGTLNEIKPMLIHETLASRLPAALIGATDSALVLVQKAKGNAACTTSLGKVGVLVSIYTQVPTPLEGPSVIPPYIRSVCVHPEAAGRDAFTAH